MPFAEVILPLALPNRTYTFSVPSELDGVLRVGQRVEVPFGKSKLYSGIIERLHDMAPPYKVKEIVATIDEVPLLAEAQLKFWDWIADYYCSTLGEVMLAALPGNMKLSSETRIVFNQEYTDDLLELSADEYLVAEALQLQPDVTIEDVRKILNRKTVLPVVQKLIHRGVALVREELQEKYKPRKIAAIRWCEPYKSNPDLLREVFDVAKSEAQVKILMAMVQLGRNQPFLKKREVLKAAGVSESPLTSLGKMGILEVYEREVSRIGDYQEELVGIGQLSKEQSEALGAIHRHFMEGKKTVLLHGVTGSGKTQVYIELIRQTILQGGQVLYLLPEIALTTQIVGRLQRVFGGDIAVYHSKINDNERVEVWSGAASGRPIVLAARSGLFLPFQNLQLIIVDEEHDPSFKQYDPAPRYNARDAAIYLAATSKANVLLGSATPAVESYFNAKTGKYGLVELNNRYGGLEMPEMDIVDLRDQQRKRTMHGIFSGTLIEHLKTAIEAGEQAILFQNRRGYAPVLECDTCGWVSQCQNCDVSLTYHKHQHALRCHYCNFRADVPETCPACGSGKLMMLGAGTEKIEDELKIFLPEARIARMDLDTAGSKSGLSALLQDFEDREIDVLIGTQMVSKGLDFENVALVGVLSADQIVRFPDFRSGERAFQLITQVSGRAGRKKKRGKVLIQAYATEHPVVKDVLDNDFQRFMARELEERQTFNYPPFSRLIHINIQHKDDKVAAAAAAYMAALLRDKLGAKRVLGPVIPPVGRIRTYYHQNIMLKLEKTGNLVGQTKQLLRKSTEMIVGKPGWSTVRVAVDVDP
jgi:primosomal protein N' (replication factor Y) (superfamily II helicase)